MSYTPTRLVEPLGSDEDDVVAFFASSPFTALPQQRGVLMLHAAAVKTDGGAALLLGRSGVGKSSLAAALVERGFPLVADDVTGVVLDAGGGPIALPGFSRQRLWAHPLEQMRWRERAQQRLRSGVAKYWVSHGLGTWAGAPSGESADDSASRNGPSPSSTRSPTGPLRTLRRRTTALGHAVLPPRL